MEITPFFLATLFLVMGGLFIAPMYINASKKERRMYKFIIGGLLTLFIIRIGFGLLYQRGFSIKIGTFIYILLMVLFVFMYFGLMYIKIRRYGDDFWFLLATLAILLILIQITMFSTVYDDLSRSGLGDLKYSGNSSKNILENKWDSYYFSSIAFTTTGYGDIYPVGWSKGVSFLEALLGQITIFGLLILAFSKMLKAPI